MLKILIFLIMIILLMPNSYAHCPLCSVAVGGGAAITRYYGVDDTIVGVWIGAFIISTALWANRILKKQYIPFQSFFIVGMSLLLTILPFQSMGLMEEHYGRIFGMSKLLFGIFTGGLVTYLGLAVSKRIKEIKGKVLFPFQTIAITLGFLALNSVLFWQFIG